jgi:hypothetical protein
MDLKQALRTFCTPTRSGCVPVPCCSANPPIIDEGPLSGENGANRLFWDYFRLPVS